MSVDREIQIISEGYVRVPDPTAARIANKINDASRAMRSAVVDVARYAERLQEEMANNQNPMSASWMTQAANKVAAAEVELNMLFDLAGRSLTQEELLMAYGEKDVYFTAQEVK